MKTIKTIENSRFKDLPWAEQATKTYALVVGAGGIGSWTSLFLARAGITIHCYDHDILEEHNLGGQFFMHEDIGLNKCSALQQAIYSACGSTKLFDYSAIPFSEHIYTMAMYDIIISAVDNMSARKQIFDAWRNRFVEDNNPERKSLLIDGRLLAEQFQIYCVHNTDTEAIRKYHKTLFDDDEIKDEPCTARQTSHVAGMIGSMITTFATNYLANQLSPMTASRAVPFLTEFYGPIGGLINMSTTNVRNV